jgi:hypothetical protein
MYLLESSSFWRIRPQPWQIVEDNFPILSQFTICLGNETCTVQIVDIQTRLREQSLDFLSLKRRYIILHISYHQVFEVPRTNWDQPFMEWWWLPSQKLPQKCKIVETYWRDHSSERSGGALFDGTISFSFQPFFGETCLFLIFLKKTSVLKELNTLIGIISKLFVPKVKRNGMVFQFRLTSKSVPQSETIYPLQKRFSV